MRKWAGVLSAALVWLAGCGYTTHVYVKETGYKTIYVAPFANRIDTTSEFSEGNRFVSYFPLLEDKVTKAVSDRYNFDGTLRLVPPEDADLTLKGEVTRYRRHYLTTNDDDEPEQYRVTVFVDITLTDNKTGQTVWEKKNMAGEVIYYTVGSYARTESDALDEVANDLARRILDLTVEAW